MTCTLIALSITLYLAKPVQSGGAVIQTTLSGIVTMRNCALQ